MELNFWTIYHDMVNLYTIYVLNEDCSIEMVY